MAGKQSSKPSAARPQPRVTGQAGVQSNGVVGKRRTRTVDDVVRAVERGNRDEVRESQIVRR